MVAGRHTRSVTTGPAKQHDKGQRDEGENGDRDGRAAGHSVYRALLATAPIGVNRRARLWEMQAHRQQAGIL